MRLIAVALVVLSACSHNEEHVSTPQDGAVEITDAAMATYAGPFTPNQLCTLDFDATTSDPLVQSIHIADGKGTLGFGGHVYPAAAYVTVPFAPYTLATIAATTENGLVITYAYCMTGAFMSLYTESLQVADTFQPSTPAGTCTFASAAPVDAAFLAPEMPLVYAPLTDVADIDGGDLVIHGGRGTMTLGGVTYDVSVFTSVDCSQCGNGGWQELHVTIAKGDVLAFAVLYLEPSSPGEVDLFYGFRFDQPSLWPADHAFDSTWTLR